MAPAKKRCLSSISPKATLQGQLQAAVQSIKWTYAALWKQSPAQKDVLIWGDGCYNGAIKTRKTVQAGDVGQEDLGLQRTRQLRELYETLSKPGEGNQANTRRPSAALTPEDLTETEWFYLLSMSCSFSFDTGLPGRALSKGQHVWLTEANNASPDVFTRCLLAKTAHVKTVVCIPVGEVVVEVGTKELVHEDLSVVQRIKAFFGEQFNPVGSEQSTSNPYGPPERWLTTYQVQDVLGGGHSLLDGGVSMLLDDGKETDPKPWDVIRDHPITGLDLDIRGASAAETDGFTQCQDRLQSGHRLGARQAREDHMTNTHGGSAFVDWRTQSARIGEGQAQSNPQWMLKKALFHITHLYGTSMDEMSSWNREADTNFSSLDCRNPNRKPLSSQEDLNVSHVLAERRRREKLNDRFMCLRALVPFVTKMDKASILGDAIEYVKQLQKRAQEMEVKMEQLELRSSPSHLVNHGHRQLQDITTKTSPSETFNGTKTDINGSQLTHSGRLEIYDFAEIPAPVVPSCDNEIRSQAEGKSSSSLASDGEEVDVCNSDEEEADASQIKRVTSDVKVNLVKNEAFLELHCPWRSSLLIDVLQTLNNLQLDVVMVHASTMDGNLTMSFNAKLKETTLEPKVMKAKIQSALQIIAAAAN